MFSVRDLCIRGVATLVLGASIIIPASAQAANYYVAPNGSSSNDGSLAHPLDLKTALSSSSPALPGDTIWLRGGTYAGNFTSVLNGTAAAPIIVRQYPGERATLDGAPSPTAGTLIIKGSYTWYWGFEVMNSYPDRNSGTSSRGPGINQFGAYTKLINLVVHDNLDGIETWSGVTEGEVYGNVIFNNGAQSSGIGAGHSIYAQNDVGTKHLIDNVMSNSYNFGIHIYTENGSINYFDVEGNIAFNHGVLASSSSYKANYLIGGSQVAQLPKVLSNYGYYPWGSQGRNGDLGYGTACNGLDMEGNYFAGGTSLKVNCTNSTVSGNSLYGSISSSIISAYPNNTYSTSKPTGTQVVVRPNKYEPGRANVAIYNWGLQSQVSVDLSGVGLKSGDTFEIRDAANFYGPLVTSGTYNGSPVVIGMLARTEAIPIGTSSPAPSTGPEFGAFVVLKTSGSSSTPAPTASLSASPSSITAGSSSTLNWSTTNSTTVSISPSVGTVSTSGSVSVSPSSTITYTLTATGSGGTATATTTVTVTAASGSSGGSTGGGSGSVSFVGSDSKTQGSWKGVYGSDGGEVMGDVDSYPSYAKVSYSASEWTWEGSTGDTRALQRISGNGRVAATAYAGTSFSIDVAFSDGSAHQVALYLLDWDGQGRAETVQVVDRTTGAVLDQRAVSQFVGGVYLTWNVTSGARLVINRTSGPNAVVSGIFLGAGGSVPTPPPSGGGSGSGSGSGSGTTAASFVSTDTSTQGTWKGKYGSKGFAVNGDVTSFPAFAQASFSSNALSWTWNSNTGDLTALQRASGSGRIAATWYETAGSFTMDLPITDGVSHQLALYLLDWDVRGRAETITITDAATGAVLDQRSASSFVKGEYLVWKVSGHVTVTFTRNAGVNAVVSGVFID
jgi:hypothetical protein